MNLLTYVLQNLHFLPDGVKVSLEPGLALQSLRVLHTKLSDFALGLCKILLERTNVGSEDRNAEKGVLLLGLDLIEVLVLCASLIQELVDGLCGSEKALGKLVVLELSHELLDSVSGLGIGVDQEMIPSVRIFLRGAAGGTFIENFTSRRGWNILTGSGSGCAVNRVR